MLFGIEGKTHFHIRKTEHVISLPTAVHFLRAVLCNYARSICKTGISSICKTGISLGTPNIYLNLPHYLKRAIRHIPVRAPNGAFKTQSCVRPRTLDWILEALFGVRCTGGYSGLRIEHASCMLKVLMSSLKKAVCVRFNS